MRNFWVFFVLGALFAAGWSCFLWGALSRFIKLLVEGMARYSLSLRKRVEKSLLKAGVSQPLACWTQPLILKGVLQLRVYVVTILESHRSMKTFKICPSCEVVISYCSCTHVPLLLPFLPPSSLLLWVEFLVLQNRPTTLLQCRWQ